MGNNIKNSLVNKLRSKQTWKILGIIGSSFALSLIIVFLFCNKSQFNGLFSTVNLSRCFLIFLAILFVVCNFAFPRKKFYNWLWCKRYILAGIFFVVTVALGMNGSSMLTDNVLIQPNSTIKNSDTIFGISHPIRGDEFNSNLPVALSQTNTEDGYNYFSDNIRGTTTDVYMTSSFAPVNDITELARPFTWGYFFLDAEHAFSFWWMGRLICLFMITLEFGMFLTKKNRKLAFALAALVTFAPAVSWWFAVGITDFLIFGQLSVLLLISYFKQNKKIYKFLLATALSISMLGFFAILYPAWEIPLAWLFGIIGLIIVIRQIMQKNVHWFDLIMLFYTLCIVGLVILRFFLLSQGTIEIMANTVYPGARFETGGGGLIGLLNSHMGALYPYIPIDNPCEPSLFIALFPIPIGYAIYTIIVTKRHHKKINPILVFLTIIAIFFSIFSIFGVPDFIAKLTLLSNAPTIRLNVIVALICVYLMVMTISLNHKTKLSKKYIWIVVGISVVYTALVVCATYSLNSSLIGKKFLILSTLLLLGFCIVYLTARNKKCLLFVICSCGFAVIGGVSVNPLISGINTFTDKPVAHKIQEINRAAPGKWVGINAPDVLANFALAQGVPVINSVNVYPNLDLMYKLDPTHKYEDVYNRYAHIGINLSTNQPTSFTLVQADSFAMTLNVNDVNKLDAKYVLSTSDLSSSTNIFKQLYYEDGVYIYQIAQ